MSAVPAAAHSPNFTGREWVLDQIATWRDQTQQRHLLITGAPGSSK